VDCWLPNDFLLIFTALHLTSMELHVKTTPCSLAFIQIFSLAYTWGLEPKLWDPPQAIFFLFLIIDQPSHLRVAVCQSLEGRQYRECRQWGTVWQSSQEDKLFQGKEKHLFLLNGSSSCHLSWCHSQRAKKQLEREAQRQNIQAVTLW